MEHLYNLDHLYNFANQEVPQRPRRREVIPLAAAKFRIFRINNAVMNDPQERIHDMIQEAIVYHRPRTRMDIDQIRLHVLCTMGHFDCLRDFIETFANQYGPFALELLLNSSITIPVPGRRMLAMTPLLSVLLWNDAPQLVRLLYSWGAAVHIYDENGLYPEEKMGDVPYFNTLSPSYALQNGEDHLMLARNRADFGNVTGEVVTLAGEMEPPPGWVRPLPMLALN